MKQSLRLLAGAAATALAVMTGVAPAGATPAPRSDEWWFPLWGIQEHVWPQTKGAGVTVGLLDSGVNASLPEISGSILRGTDTGGRKSDGRKDFDAETGGHGTAMANLIVAHGGGATSFVGIAPDARILPVHVSSEDNDQADFDDSISEGIHYVVDHGVRVINISLGTDIGTPPYCPDLVENAVAYALHHDVVVVAASGNKGDTTNWPSEPGSCPGVLTVGAIDKKLNPSVHTQREPYIAVGAPGVGVGFVDRADRYHPYAWGTSSAAALVSGAVALIRSQNPKMPARTVVQRLIATAHRIGNTAWNYQTGYGGVQITAAMYPDRFPVPANAPNPVYAAFDKWQASQTHSTTPSAPKAAPPADKKSAAGNKHSNLPFVLGGAGILAVMVLVIASIALRRNRG